MLKFPILFLIVFGMSVSVNAATGCVLNSNKSRIYTKKQSGINYRTSPYSTAPAGCTYVQTTTACTVGGSGPGFLGNTTTVVCPIDDYVWLIVALFGGLGFIHVRKKNLI